MLGIEKLNTTASHPQCNEAVERLNRALKTMYRKFGLQWDQYLSGLIAILPTVYITEEKPSFSLFSFNCCSRMETALLPTKSPIITNISDYREQAILSLSSARSLAEQTSKEA